MFLFYLLGFDERRGYFRRKSLRVLRSATKREKPKTNYSEGTLYNDESSLNKQYIDNSNKDLNAEEDLKALHSLYIKDLFKDRIAAVVPFDSNLTLASFSLSDIKERSEFLKE